MCKYGMNSADNNDFGSEFRINVYIRIYEVENVWNIF